MKNIKKAPEPVLVSLTENPCKMCMPMGASMALKGIEGAMTILHGSQGCATYIRRHMAGHFHEPVDIASTSLSEEGTVYGGEKNLRRGIGNLVRLYAPKMVAVATTCLAETIGEDVGRIVADVAAERPEGPLLVPVKSPGYGGSQEEGWYAALLAVVATLAGKEQGVAGDVASDPNQDPQPDSKPGPKTDPKPGSNGTPELAESPLVALVLPPLNPGDVRGIRRLLDLLQVRHVLLPDISETLDAGWRADWERIPPGGTPLAAIAGLHRASVTIEVGAPPSERLSVGRHLQERFGVPFHRLEVPVGVRATDRFVSSLLPYAGGCAAGAMPHSLVRERARLLDALVDSHKHLAEARVCIAGAPSFCRMVTRLLAESGAHVEAVMTGTALEGFPETIAAILSDCGADPADQPLVSADADYRRFRDALEARKVNLAVGGSDARYLERSLGIPLIRMGFPVHDRMGAQRLCVIGYEGATALLDPVANAMLTRKHATFRGRAKRYLPGGDAARERAAAASGDPSPILSASTSSVSPTNVSPTAAARTSTVLPASGMAVRAAKTDNHPCFSPGACKNARVHLPVAPACNLGCRYCNRKYDCVNESRPGVTSAVLSPAQAVARFAEVRRKVPNLTVVGIAGPGDALANFLQTEETLAGIRRIDPDVTFCLSTNGLRLPFHVERLHALGVTHLTVTVNAVDPTVGARLYRSCVDDGILLEGEAAARLLLERQLAGIRMAVALGMVVKVNSVLVPEINGHHLPDVVAAMRDLGVSLSNIMPLIPAPGSDFAHLPQTSRAELDRVRAQCGGLLPQMLHCRQCRADAVGTLDHDRSAELMRAEGSGGGDRDMDKVGERAVSGDAGRLPFRSEPSTPPASLPGPGAGDTWLAAVATSEGVRVDRHFGQVEVFHLYRVEGRRIVPVEKRRLGKYCHGSACDGTPDTPSGSGPGESAPDRTTQAVSMLADCRMVVALRIGHVPEQALEQAGVMVVRSCDLVETAILDAAALMSDRGREKQHA